MLYSRTRRIVSGLSSPLVLLLVLSVEPATWARSSRKAQLTVESVPSGALVSVHDTPEPEADAPRTVAGETPLTRQFNFGKAHNLWLEVEKRGFKPELVEVGPTTGTATVTLTPLDSEVESQAPRVARLLALDPQVVVIRRGFASEHHSEEESQLACQALGGSVRTLAGTWYEVVTPTTAIEPAAVRALWRDGRTAMEMLDPIRLPFLATTPRLETRSAREAVRQLGESLGVDAVLLVEGKQNKETGGMKTGKVGIMVAGTAASYASGYGRAATSGDTFFTYNIYLPSFAEGMLLRALLVHCATGEVLWLNKGLWKPVSFERTDQVGEVVTDLLTGLQPGPAEPARPSPEKTEQPENGQEENR